ncbi:MAG: hypothetical protein JW742_05230 [Candidatus Aminicenantes bacterium]|nr:hypothetical protein [Candidatus Aminicenantes bacterium]
MSKRILTAAIVIVILFAACPLAARGQDYPVKKIRAGGILGWNWATDSELSDMGSSFLLGFDLGIMVKDRLEIYVAPVFQQSISIMLLGLGDTFTSFNLLLGAYHHLLTPRPWIDLKIGGGLVLGQVMFEQKDDKSGLGVWAGAALEVPVRLSFVEPRWGLELRYQSLRIDVGKTVDFGGIQLLSTFRLGF